MCLPSDALLQHLLSYLGFSYLGLGVSLHGCSSKAQLLLLTLDKGYLLPTALPDLQHGIAPLGPPTPEQPPLLRLVLPAAAPGLQLGVAPPGCRPWPRASGGSSRPLPLTSMWGSSSRPLPLASGVGQIGSGQTRDGKSEHRHSRNQRTKMDWNG